MEGLSIKILSYLVVGLICGWAGYILKDRLTIEKEVTVNIRRIKNKGDASSIDLTQDIDVTTEEQKVGWFERLKRKREKKKAEKKR